MPAMVTVEPPSALKRSLSTPRKPVFVRSPLKLATPPGVVTTNAASRLPMVSAATAMLAVSETR